LGNPATPGVKIARQYLRQTLKILYITPEYPLPNPSGGIAGYLRDIARETAQRGHEVKIICQDEAYAGEGAVHIDFDEGVEIHYVSKSLMGTLAKVLETPRLRRLFRFAIPDLVPLIPPLTAFCYWRRLRRQWRPDIIETFDWKATGLLFALFEGGIPVVFRGGGHCKALIPYNDLPWNHFFESQHRLERWTARASTLLVPCSELLGEDEARDFQIPKEKILPVPNCVSLIRTGDPGGDPSGRGTTKVAFVGRLELRKGIDLLVKAAERLYVKYPEVDYYLVGRIDKDPFQFLNTKGPGRGVREKIHLTGPIPRDKVYDTLAGCDFAVFPSRYEPFGNVALEAMACGLPVIVSDRGGWREAVEEGETGFVCRAGDVDSLREAMERMILLSREKRVDMGRRGRERVVRDYSARAVADRMIAIYEKLTPGGSTTYKGMGP